MFLEENLGDFLGVSEEDKAVELDDVDLLFFIVWMPFVQESDLRRVVC